MLEKLKKKTVLIWSDEWKLYWKPKAQGYTQHKSNAGIYKFEDAWAKVKHCGPDKKIKLIEADI